MFVCDVLLRESARMFSFLGELLCCVTWLISRVFVVLYGVFPGVPVPLATHRMALRRRVNSCEFSWPVSVARCWAGSPPQGCPYVVRVNWHLFATPRLACISSQSVRRN